jgi:hypothetical protein
MEELPSKKIHCQCESDLKTAGKRIWKSAAINRECWQRLFLKVRAHSEL